MSFYILFTYIIQPASNVSMTQMKKSINRKLLLTPIFLQFCNKIIQAFYVVTAEPTD
jgi:hypothetical protein